MMIEMAHDERHVDVTRLAYRLSIIHRFEHGEMSRVLLNTARAIAYNQRARAWPSSAFHAGNAARAADTAASTSACDPWAICASSAPDDGSCTAKYAAGDGVTHRPPM